MTTEYVNMMHIEPNVNYISTSVTMKNHHTFCIAYAAYSLHAS